MIAQPEKPVLVYDGSCSFCRGQVARIRRKDKADRFDFVSQEEPNLTERFPQLAGEDLNSGMRLVMPDGSVAAGADAAYEIARRVPGWRAGAWLYRVPVLRGVFRWGYRWVARNRHKLGKTCDDGACDVNG